jgi:hypothetical protein
MARITSHVPFAVWKLRVNLASHGNHTAGDIFVGVIVAGEIALHMAEGAFHAQSGFKCHHGRHQFVRGKEFQVFWRRHGVPLTRRRGRILAKGRNQKKQQEQESRRQLVTPSMWAGSYFININPIPVVFELIFVKCGVVSNNN